jgi:hypothetical protein
MKERFTSCVALLALGFAGCGAADAPESEKTTAEVTASAVGQYQWGAAYTGWKQVSGQTYTNWEQSITVVQSAPNTFWNIQGSLYFGPDFYLGVQTPGNVPRFLFSMWGATAFQAPAGGNCQAFGGEGTGLQCFTPVGESIVNKTIRLVLVKSNRTNQADLWWSAWATISGRGVYLGQLKSPWQGHIRTAGNFTEYFGPGEGWDGTRCVGAPPPNTAVVYGAPTVSSPTLSARKLPWQSGTLAHCPGPSGQSIQFMDGAYHFLGTSATPR